MLLPLLAKSDSGRKYLVQQAMGGHLVKAALEMGGRVTSVEEK